MSNKNFDYRLDTVDQVRENLINMTQIMLSSWVKTQRKSFTIGDIYADPTMNSDLYVNREMIKAIKEALIRLNCEPVSSDEFDSRFMPPVRLIDRDLLVS